VGLVTLFAFGLNHILGMRLVALGAVGYFAMNVVTEGTGEGTVLALVLAQFLYLRRVAGQAGIGDIVAELDYFRGVLV